MKSRDRPPELSVAGSVEESHTSKRGWDACEQIEVQGVEVDKQVGPSGHVEVVGEEALVMSHCH